MPRHLYPSDRFSYSYTIPGAPLILPPLTEVTMYTDEAITTLASIQTPDGVAIAGSVISTSLAGHVPEFLGPVDVLRLWAKPWGAPVYPLDAQFGPRLTQLELGLGGLSWKAAVRAASTANVSLSAPGASLDGVTLSSGDRILLKAQTAGAENGIWVWTGAAAALSRATDADSSAELTGATVLVNEGTDGANKGWTQSADSPTVGTTSLTWAQFGGSALYVAGNGMGLSGSTFNVVPGNGILADGSSTRVDPAVTVRKYASDIGDGAATVIARAHGLGTDDLTYTLRYKATGEVADADADCVIDATNITLTFAVAPTTDQFRIVAHG